MKPKIKNAQLIAAFNLIKGLNDFQNKRLGTVKDVIAMYNPSFPGYIFLRYEKSFFSAGEIESEFRIAQIDGSGIIHYLDAELDSIKKRYAFLAECTEFSIDNPSEYYNID